MANNDSQQPSARGTTRRALFLVAALALAGLAYAIARVDILRARIVNQEIKFQTMQNNDDLLRSQIEALGTAGQTSSKQVEKLQSDLSSLSDNFGQLRSQAEQAQRQATRSETLYLLRLANDQLRLAHDVGNGLDTLTAVDSLLSNSDDAALISIRQQFTDALAQLHALPKVDLNALQQQLNTVEQQSNNLRLANISVSAADPAQADATLPAAGLQRGWTLFKRGLASLFTIRKTGAAATVLSTDEQTLRRRHLQVLVLDARLAAYLHDQNNYLAALRAADALLAQTFDSTDAGVGQTRALLTDLTQYNVAPVTPDLSASIQALTRYLPGGDKSAAP